MATIVFAMWCGNHLRSGSKLNESRGRKSLNHSLGISLECVVLVLNAETERNIVSPPKVKFSGMADFVQCEITSPSETPTLVDGNNASKLIETRPPSVEEMLKLRNAIKELHERHEEDRKCILILQSQIDHMRGAKCTDSFESSFKLMLSAASYIWSKVPSISLSDLLKESNRKGKKRGSKGVSSASTSTTYSIKKSKDAYVKSKPESKRKVGFN